MNYFLSIFFGTFLLEDLALASALTLMAQNKITLLSAFLACFLGIGLGDLLIYAAGWLLGRSNWVHRFAWISKVYSTFSNPKALKLMTYSLIICRFIPGTRLPTYLAAGLLQYSFWSFFLLTWLTVGAWVGMAFIFGSSLSGLLAHHWLLSLVILLLLFKILKSVIPPLFNYWDRRALFNSWRKWRYFEFWPGTLFYLPLIPYYIYLSLRHRSFLLPFYANPLIENGGLIGESKWDFLQHLEVGSPHRLKTIKIAGNTELTQVHKALAEASLSYPLILKPDVGQRGFGVRIIRTDQQLKDYLALATFDLIAQELSPYEREAGIFYIKHPTAARGFIFSMTDKKFPFVIGDGIHSLGDLILNDRRARMIAAIYFSRHRDHLDKIIPLQEQFFLAECGNHSQGAIFLNGQHLKTDQLLASVEKVVSTVPHFYFGRLDVRYENEASLMAGVNYHIVEINGAGAEATHIWDSQMGLVEAYQTLFEQWGYLFEIGTTVKKQKMPARVFPLKLLKESWKVFFRKESLSVSS